MIPILDPIPSDLLAIAPMLFLCGGLVATFAIAAWLATVWRNLQTRMWIQQARDFNDDWKISRKRREKQAA